MNDTASTQTPLTSDEIASRLPQLRARLDARIAELRKEVRTYAEGIARDATRAAEQAYSDDRVSRLATSSASAQLDAAIVELNVLIQERKMLTWATGETPEKQA